MTAGTLADLLRQELEPIRFVVDGLICEGLTILAGKPKLGKSWLALGIALAVCAGHEVLGFPSVAGEVLYIALEDGERRLQDRVRVLGGQHLGAALASFNYSTDWEKFTRGGIDQLAEWMREHPATRLIIVDTYGKARGPLPGRDRYQEEYELVGKLQSFAVEYRVAVVLIHHLRKEGADDWLEQLSGSQALTGAADTLLGLFRERGQMDATLRLVSREIDEKDLALRFDRGRWEAMGDAAIYRQSVERMEVLRALEDLGGEARVAEVAQLVEKTSANVSKMLVALSHEGIVKRARRGVYTLVDSVDTVENEPSVSTQSTISTGGVDQGEPKRLCLLCGERLDPALGDADMHPSCDLPDPWEGAR